jgi:hypothetical protein
MSRSTALDVHVARVLLLVGQFKKIDGLTKIAKLDFLLRYPALTVALCNNLGIPAPDPVLPTEEESLAVETRMIRYKYGPWDDRYYPIIGAIVGMGLATTAHGKGSVVLVATDQTDRICEELNAKPEWRRTALRTQFLAEHFDRSGSELKSLIYQNLPSAMDRPWRVVI